MKIHSPKAAHEFFKTRLAREVEEFWVAALNSNKEVIAAACLFRGTVDQCLFHPRDVFRFAYLHNAVSIVVAHNHPSGDVRPSPLDLNVTGQLLDVAVILQMPIEDHLIISGGRYFSFLQSKLMGKKSTDPVLPSY